MIVQPNRLASALAAAYGATTPKPLLGLRHLPCPRCDGRRLMTICPQCNGLGKVMVIQ